MEKVMGETMGLNMKERETKARMEIGKGIRLKG